MLVRPASPADYAHFAALFPSLGVPDPTPDAERWRKEMERDTWLVELEAEPVGYAYAVVLGDTLYVRQIVVAEGARRRGCARALLDAVTREALGKGVTRWCLYVVPDNVAAVTLYESRGLRKTRSSSALRAPFALATRLEHRQAIRVRRADEPSALDAEVERSLGLLAGQLESLRSSGRVVWVAEEHGEFTGVAPFDPSFPGAFPFRARDAAAVRALLEAMQSVAAPELHTEPWRKRGAVIVIEGDEALASALVAQGAELALHTVFMEGALVAPGQDIGRPS